jgi:hypothetical protein
MKRPTVRDQVKGKALEAEGFYPVFRGGPA